MSVRIQFLNCKIDAFQSISWGTEGPGFIGNVFQDPSLGAFCSERGQRLREEMVRCCHTFSLAWNLDVARSYASAEELEAVLVDMQFKPHLCPWMGP